MCKECCGEKMIDIDHECPTDGSFCEECYGCECKKCGATCYHCL